MTGKDIKSKIVKIIIIIVIICACFLHGVSLANDFFRFCLSRRLYETKKGS
jgi:hypothetical protein